MQDSFTATGRLTQQPSLVQLAADEMRRMILSGELAPGERIREQSMTEILGISRPPLREAIGVLQRTGLVERAPRRGATVVSLSYEDAEEILLLRATLEQVAVRHGVPARSSERLQRCRDAVEAMWEAAREHDRTALVERGYAFHSAIVDLPGMPRLSEFYRSLHDQLMVCMALNLYVRETHYEDLTEHVRRHQHLLELIEDGEPHPVLAALAQHGERSFTHHPHG